MGEIVYELRLYVVDRTSSSVRAINDLKTLLERELPGRFSLKVIDVLEHPQMAEDDKVIATPTVVKSSPAPVRKALGDLSDGKGVLFGLGLE